MESLFLFALQDHHDPQDNKTIGRFCEVRNKLMPPPCDRSQTHPHLELRPVQPVTTNSWTLPWSDKINVCQSSFVDASGGICDSVLMSRVTGRAGPPDPPLSGNTTASTLAVANGASGGRALPGGHRIADAHRDVGLDSRCLNHGNGHGRMADITHEHTRSSCAHDAH